MSFIFHNNYLNGLLNTSLQAQQHKANIVWPPDAMSRSRLFVCLASAELMSGKNIKACAVLLLCRSGKQHRLLVS